jgi:hypothetical protein
MNRSPFRPLAGWLGVGIRRFQADQAWTPGEDGERRLASGTTVTLGRAVDSGDKPHQASSLQG